MGRDKTLVKADQVQPGSSGPESSFQGTRSYIFCFPNPILSTSENSATTKPQTLWSMTNMGKKRKSQDHGTTDLQNCFYLQGWSLF